MLINKILSERELGKEAAVFASSVREKMNPETYLWVATETAFFILLSYLNLATWCSCKWVKPFHKLFYFFAPVKFYLHYKTNKLKKKKWSFVIYFLSQGQILLKMWEIHTRGRRNNCDFVKTMYWFWKLGTYFIKQDSFPLFQIQAWEKSHIRPELFNTLWIILRCNLLSHVNCRQILRSSPTKVHHVSLAYQPSENMKPTNLIFCHRVNIYLPLLSDNSNMLTYCESKQVIKEFHTAILIIKPTSDHDKDDKDHLLAIDYDQSGVIVLKSLIFSSTMFYS